MSFQLRLVYLNRDGFMTNSNVLWTNPIEDTYQIPYRIVQIIVEYLNVKAILEDESRPKNCDKAPFTTLI